jgi:hypothetical protein
MFRYLSVVALGLFACLSQLQGEGSAEQPAREIANKSAPNLPTAPTGHPPTAHSLDIHRPKPNAAPPDQDKSHPNRRINALQLLGTHNSYHLAPDPVAMKVVSLFAPGEAKSIDCSQRPLTEQLESLGCRHFELDLYRDDEGNLFNQPLAMQMARQQQIDVPPHDPQGRLRRPGIKILHSPDFDFRTTTYTFADALREVRAWSDSRRDHVPIFFLLELKSDSFSPTTRPIAWDEPGFVTLEREIQAAFPRDRILTPDDVRDGKATLRDAVDGIGWPDVDRHRGKVAFLLDNEDRLRDLYLAKSDILAGRMLFVSVPPTHPAAAWMKRNDPIGSYDEIRELVKRGFLVRTRSDSGTVEARTDDTRRRDRALASGAQLISTDFPEPDPRFSPYAVRLPKAD